MNTNMEPARIRILAARESNTAIIFRRGPSKWVQVLKWNTTTDEIEEGQWFKGRIYTNKCDLSPSGKYMIYFAAKFKEKNSYYSWTGISKPPYLTTLALWKKKDTFDGGGLFIDEKTIYLNHRKEESEAERTSDTKDLKIAINTTNWAEIYDIEGEKLKRDNWVWKKGKEKVLLKRIDEKRRIEIRGIKKEQETLWSYYLINNLMEKELKEVDSIEVNPKGRILLGIKGCIYGIDKIEEYIEKGKMKLIVDLNVNKPYELEAPEEMKKW